jgi:ABC-type dipeptide/oligopeptide/nickel transport system ATPase component
MIIFLGNSTNHQHIQVFHDFGKSATLGIVGEIGIGKSVLLSNILNQFQGEKYIIDTTEELRINDTLPLSDLQEIEEFLQENANNREWKAQRLIIIDELSDITNGSFKKDIRDNLNLIIRKARHYNINLCLASQEKSVISVNKGSFKGNRLILFPLTRQKKVINLKKSVDKTITM